MKLKGSVTVFVLLILGLIIGMYLVGFTPPIYDFIATDVISQDIDDDGNFSGNYSVNESFTGESFLNAIAGAIFSPLGLAFLGIAVGYALLTGLISGGASGAVSASILTYMIPAFIIFLVANIFFFPILPYAQAEGLPSEISLMMMVIFNTLLLLAIVSFITGRD